MSKFQADGVKSFDQVYDDIVNSSTPSKLERSLIKIKLFRERHQLFISRTQILFLNAVAVGYFSWATYHFIESSSLFENYLKKLPSFNHVSLERQYEASDLKQSNETEEETCGVVYCGIQWCDGYGMLIILFAFTYIGLLYYQIKQLLGKQIQKKFDPIQKRIVQIFRFR